MPFEEQTASIFAGTNGYLDNVGVADVSRYEAAMIAYLRSDHAGVLKTIRDTKDLGDDAKKGLVAALEAFAKRSEEHTSELQSLMRISYAVFCLKKKKQD